MKKHADIQYSLLNKGFSVTALSFIAEWHLRSQSWWNLASSRIQKKKKKISATCQWCEDCLRCIQKHFVKVLSLLLSLKESVPKVRLHKFTYGKNKYPKIFKSVLSPNILLVNFALVIVNKCLQNLCWKQNLFILWKCREFGIIQCVSWLNGKSYLNSFILSMATL